MCACELACAFVCSRALEHVFFVCLYLCVHACSRCSNACGGLLWELTDRVNSVTLVGIAEPFTKEAVSQVRATIIATHLALFAQAHVALAVGTVKALTVRIPPEECNTSQ